MYVCFNSCSVYIHYSLRFKFAPSYCYLVVRKLRQKIFSLRIHLCVEGHAARVLSPELSQKNSLGRAIRSPLAFLSQNGAKGEAAEDLSREKEHRTIVHKGGIGVIQQAAISDE